jgi:lysophospholipase L1-like esterase
LKQTIAIQQVLFKNASMNQLVIVICLFATVLARSRVSSAEAGHDFHKWERDISTFEQMDRKNPPAQGGLLFIGSSTIKLWKTLAQDFPKHHVINRGFGGSEIVDSTHFASRIIFPYRPQMIFLRAGGNDLWAGKTPEQVFADFKDFVAEINSKLPKAQIGFISLSPSIARLKQSDREQAVNKMVKQFAQQKPTVKYIDTWSVPLGSNNEPSEEFFLPDKLHFNDAGYRRLVERVRAFLPVKP